LKASARDQTEKINGEAMRQLARGGAKTPPRDFFRGSYEQTVRRAAKTRERLARTRRFRRAPKKQTVVGES
jgi:hypothetical protein